MKRVKARASLKLISLILHTSTKKRFQKNLTTTAPKIIRKIETVNKIVPLESVEKFRKNFSQRFPAVLIGSIKTSKRRLAMRYKKRSKLKTIVMPLGEFIVSNLKSLKKSGLRAGLEGQHTR